MNCFLVIDAGSGSVKCFLVSPSGEVLKSSEREWSRDEWRCVDAWHLIAESIQELTREPGVDILAVSSTSMREEFVLLDRQGIQLEFTLSLESEKYGSKVLEENGEQMYLSSGHWPIPNWMAGAIVPWITHENPSLSGRISSMLMISDWVNYKLCGEAATEGSSACETSLFNIQTYDWDWNIIESIGIPRSIFPRVKRNGETLGHISLGASRNLKLPEGTPVVMGGADTQCGLLGMGVNEGEASAVGGTTTPVQVIVDKPVFDPLRRIWSNNYLTSNYWIIESNAGYTGRVVKWLRDTLLKHDSDYTELNRLAENAPPGSHGLNAYLGPHLFDSGPPYWATDKLGNLPVKPTLTGNYKFDVSDLCRAAIEANCYAVKANLCQLQEVSSLDFKSLNFCGGNSRSEFWMQIQADVLELPVEVPLIHHSTAVGAAVLASTGIGYHRSIDEAVKQMIKPKRLYKPRTQISKKYKAHYANWIKTRERLARK